MKPHEFLTQTELEEKPGIKAQHAVAAALKIILARAGTGWDVEETGVGSSADKAGIDLYLFCESTGQKIRLDTSFRDKEDTAFLVLLRPWWFEEEEDGSFKVKPEHYNALIQAIKPALAQASYMTDGRG